MNLDRGIKPNYFKKQSSLSSYRFKMTMKRFRKTLQKFQLIQTTFSWNFSMGNKGCQKELKFCEVSRNPKSNKCQISILTNKKLLFLKKILKCTMYHGVVLFPANRSLLDVLTFLIHIFRNEWTLSKSWLITFLFIMMILGIFKILICKSEKCLEVVIFCRNIFK